MAGSSTGGYTMKKVLGCAALLVLIALPTGATAGARGEANFKAATPVFVMSAGQSMDAEMIYVGQEGQSDHGIRSMAIHDSEVRAKTLIVGLATAAILGAAG